MQPLWLGDPDLALHAIEDLTTYGANIGLDADVTVNVDESTPLGRVTAKAKRWSHSNPQTQEAWQAP